MKVISGKELLNDKKEWNRVYNFLSYNDLLKCFSKRIYESPCKDINDRDYIRKSHKYTLSKKEAAVLLEKLEAHLSKKADKGYKFKAVGHFVQALRDFVAQKD